MLVTIDPGSEEPLFEQLAAGIRREAATGSVRPGERLPTARELAASLGMNLHTVLRAYQDLREEGLIDMRRGRGAVVTDAAAHWQSLSREIDDLVQRARALGISADTLSSLVKEAFR